MTTKYGFTEASIDGKPAWFHTRLAAQRFARSCGWGHADPETTDNAAPEDILDAPDAAWDGKPTCTPTVAAVVPVRDTLEEHDHTPAKAMSSRVPWRHALNRETMTYEIWTRADGTPGSRNNYVVAEGIQDAGEAELLARAPELLADNARLSEALRAIQTEANFSEADGAFDPGEILIAVRAIADKSLAGKEAA